MELELIPYKPYKLTIEYFHIVLTAFSLNV